MANNSEKEEQTMQTKGIAKRIQTLLAIRGMTLIDLAKKIPAYDKDGNKKTLTNATLSARINGNPSIKGLYEIADALGVHITELFPKEEEGNDLFSQRQNVQEETTKTTQQTGQSLQSVAFCPHCGAKVRVGVVLLPE